MNDPATGFSSPDSVSRQHKTTGSTTRRDVLGMLSAPFVAPLFATRAEAFSMRAEASSAERTWEMTGHDRAEFSSFDLAMKSFMQARSISAGALAVTRNSRLVYARGFSWRDSGAKSPPIEPTSLFRIASLSKPITATAVIRLFADLQMDLSSTRLVDVLSLTPPEGQFADPQLADVSVLDLLQHLGGWDRELSRINPMFNDFEVANTLDVSLPVSTDDIVTYMTGQPLQHFPGTKYSYNNYGYCLLGKIIEALSGTSYQHYVSESVFLPLGVTKPVTGRTLQEHLLANEARYETQFLRHSVTGSRGAMVPSCYGGFNVENQWAGGGWVASAVDMVRFASTFDDPSVSPVLDPLSVDRMFELPQNRPRSAYTRGDFYYGNGWAVRDYGAGGRNTWHFGAMDGTFAGLIRLWDGTKLVRSVQPEGRLVRPGVFRHRRNLAQGEKRGDGLAGR